MYRFMFEHDDERVKLETLNLEKGLKLLINFTDGIQSEFAEIGPEPKKEGPIQFDVNEEDIHHPCPPKYSDPYHDTPAANVKKDETFILAREIFSNLAAVTDRIDSIENKIDIICSKLDAPANSAPQPKRRRRKSKNDHPETDPLENSITHVSGLPSSLPDQLSEPEVVSTKKNQPSSESDNSGEPLPSDLKKSETENIQLDTESKRIQPDPKPSPENQEPPENNNDDAMGEFDF